MRRDYACQAMPRQGRVPIRDWEDGGGMQFGWRGVLILDRAQRDDVAFIHDEVAVQPLQG